MRIEEMRQSIYIIEQSLNLFINLKDSSNTNYLSNKFGINKESSNKYFLDNKLIALNRNQIKNSMENLIQHFKTYSEGFKIKDNFCYVPVEAPKGEFGSYIMSNNTFKPYRCKIRAPGFFHLQGLDSISKNHFLADVVTIIGTLDIVFGEVDR
jgi:NADH:ubiquinone oxidoreductase subunit D